MTTSGQTAVGKPVAKKSRSADIEQQRRNAVEYQKKFLVASVTPNNNNKLISNKRGPETDEDVSTQTKKQKKNDTFEHTTKVQYNQGQREKAYQWSLQQAAAVEIKRNVPSPVKVQEHPKVKKLEEKTKTLISQIVVQEVVSRIERGAGLPIALRDEVTEPIITKLEEHVMSTAVTLLSKSVAQSPDSSTLMSCFLTASVGIPLLTTFCLRWLLDIPFPASVYNCPIEAFFSLGVIWFSHIWS